MAQPLNLLWHTGQQNNTGLNQKKTINNRMKNSVNNFASKLTILMALAFFIILSQSADVKAQTGRWSGDHRERVAVSYQDIKPVDNSEGIKSINKPRKGRKDIVRDYSSVLYIMVNGVRHPINSSNQAVNNNE